MPPSRRLLARLAILCVVNLACRAVVAFQFPPFHEEIDLACGDSVSPGESSLGSPPIVWLQAASRAVLPDHPVLAGRLVALGLGTILPWMVGWLAWRLFRDLRIAAWSVVLSLTLPLFVAGGIFNLTVVPMVLLVLLGLAVFQDTLDKGRWRDGLVCGAAWGLALLSQWTALLPALACCLFILRRGDYRRTLARPGPWVALVVAGTLAWPVLTGHPWHKWAPLAQFGESQHRLCFSLNGLSETLVEQLPDTGLLLVPLLIGLWSPAGGLPAHIRSSWHFVRLMSLVPLGLFLVIGGLTEMHPHWTVSVYPPAVIALACVAVHSRGPQPVRWLKRLVLLSFWGGLLATVALGPVLWLIREATPEWPPLVADRFLQAKRFLFGYEQLLDDLEARLPAGAARGRVLFTLNANTTGMLTFRRAEPVVDLGTLFYPVSDTDPGTSFESHVGAGGLFVTEREESFEDRLRLWFEEVQEQSPAEVHIGDVLVGHFRVYRVINLCADKLARLRTAPGSIWLALPERFSLDITSVERQPGGGPRLLRLAGWMGFAEEARPPTLEVRLNGQAVRVFRPDLDRPDVEQAFPQSRGKSGAPVLRCGFDVGLELPEGPTRVQVIASTTLGEKIVLDRDVADLEGE